MVTAESKIYHSNQAVNTCLLESFDDPRFDEAQWLQLLTTGDTNGVNMTWKWQRSWWKTFGRGRLLLILVELNGVPVALAPLFTEEGMIYNLCPEDCLDFIGDISEPYILDAILETARSEVKDFSGFEFYFIPDTSKTGNHLQAAAKRLGFDCYSYDELPSPWLDMKGQPETANEMTRKKSLRRHENYFQRNGGIEVLHLQDTEEILPHLEDFFHQHINRRASTNAPSIFLDPGQQYYYRHLTTEIGSTGWLRFTRINWNNLPIAFHFGLCYNGRYLFGIPSFDIKLSEHSPGEVLIRQLLLAALDEQATSFDFGVGDEAYKYRFSTNITKLYNWGLYPQHL